jgi:hypothetical protein
MTNGPSRRRADDHKWLYEQRFITTPRRRQRTKQAPGKTTPHSDAAQTTTAMGLCDAAQTAIAILRNCYFV